ncbi:hypothetical protein WA026_016391 [Henosepilachna vigintioctopunctata]|uniref:Peptidase M3A/M3B catalytic domain-containing protein n=1 Tax=Henosepilachna vigintioctopunctata TaxID=420089 RepID=A0AAW1UL39_9CUCU
MSMLIRSGRILCSKKLLTVNPRNVGYIVLLPEIGDDTSKDQLSQSNGLPEFGNYTIENCTAAIARQTLEFESAVRKIERDIASSNINIEKDVLERLELISSPLELTWGISKTLYFGNNTLIPTKTYLPIHERARRARITKYNNIKIYNAVRNALSSEKEMDSEVKTVLKKFSLEGKLNGLNLKENELQMLKECLNKLTSEKHVLKQKIEVQTHQFSHTITEYNTVRDFPKDLLEITSMDSRNYLNGPWKITLQPNIYIPTMQYCPDREIRWNLWHRIVTRGSGYLDRDKATGIHIEEIRYQRHEVAKLLGYDTFADMSMETKMAGSVENVKKTINILLEKAKPAQDLEMKKLYDFSVENGFKYDRLELWDVPYWRKRQELLKHGFNSEEYKKYFPYPKVLQGLFQLCEKLFNVVLKHRKEVSTWHKDVKYYDVLEPHCSAPVAGFYLDPYARKDNKIHNLNSDGWMISIQNKSRICDKIPLAALIFNFDLPSNDSPSHLSIKDVNSLFYRFGHALQHLLTRTSFSEVAGLSNVEWDMVGVCGHVFTHFLYNEDTLKSISCNLDTGEKLPINMINSFLEVRKHMAGYDLSKELYLSALDLELYSKKDYWLKVVRNLWPQFRSFPLDKQDAHLCSFTQIFTEEWAAAYYSHVWSRMIASDVYGAFQEAEGDENQMKDVGRRFRETFLALGGSVESAKIFRHFRGRDHSHQSFLNYLGLDSNK